MATTAASVKRQRREAGLLGHMVNRITSIVGSDDGTAVELGRAWYVEARKAALAIDPLNTARAAGVIAALSPRNTWRVNVAQARKVIAAADAGAGCPAVSTMDNRRKAWEIANGGDPAQVLSGPKVQRFYRNIMGDVTAVTVDVWAARAAEGRDNPNAPQDRRYALIERAYRIAAERLNLTPAECQAAAWVIVRGAAD